MSRRHADPLRHRGPGRAEAVVIVTASTALVLLALGFTFVYWPTL
jgi:hypothetical protein